MEKIITASLLFLVSLALIILSIRSFLQKGYLFNNSYIYATEKERENMDKKPYYHQSGIVFLMIASFFLLDGIGLLFSLDWPFIVAGIFMVITLIYAIVSSISLNKKK